MLLLSLKKDEIRDEKWWRSTPVTSLHIQERSEDFLGEGHGSNATVNFLRKTL